MTVITLSRQLGSRGDEIATGVAEALGLRLIDAETIDQAALKAGVPEVALAELEHEGERGLANQMLNALRAMPGLPSVPPPATPKGDEPAATKGKLSGLSMPFAGLFSPTVPPISASLDSYVRLVCMVIRGLARQGDVVILGRGGQAVLRNSAAAVHVQVVAPQSYRVDQVMARLGLNRHEAQNRVRASDRARSDYLRRYHNVDWLDPTLYHLAINTGRVSVTTAVELIIAVQRAALPPQAGEPRQPG